MKLYKFSVVDDYLVIEFNGKKVDVYPREDVFLEAERLLKFNKVHIRYHSDEIVKFTQDFEYCSLSEDTRVSVEEFLQYFTDNRVGLTGEVPIPPIDYTAILTDIFHAVDDLEVTAESINLNAEQINLNTDEVEQLLKDIKLLIESDTTGESCATPSHIKDCDREELLSKLDEIVTAINTSSVDEQAILNTISTKLDELVVIKDKLVEIATSTNTTNTKLDEAIAKLQAQILLLTDLKAEAQTANVNLLAIKTSLDTINTNILLIKDDISEIKTGVASIDNKLTGIATQLGTIHSDLVGINTTLQTEFDQTQAKLDLLIQAVNNKGIDCANKVFVSDCDKQEYLDALTEIKNAIINSSTDMLEVFNSIDSKLDDLSLIKAELIKANTTLTSINTDTTLINTNLSTLIAKLEAQIVLLTDLKVQAIEANANLVDIKTKLDTINGNIVAIKDDLSLIKIDVSSIKTSVASIDTKLTSVVDSLDSIETKLDTVHNDLLAINTTLQTEFDQTQAKLDELKTSVEFAQDTFQLEDCDGLPIGPSQNVLKVVQLAKQTATICNVDEFATAINTGADYSSIINKLDEVVVATNKVDENTNEIESKLDILVGLSTPILIENKSYKITAGQTITFEAGKVFAYGAGVFNGSANYTEGGSLIGDYTQGESFGNGDKNNLIPNINPIIINALANGDIRISVLQVPSYSPIIS
jgi:chromosome segregation ATPase